MAENLQETKRIQFLLINLILLAVFILGLLLMIGAYRLYIAPDPTFTPTITPTPQPSFTPTTTPTITLTPTPSQTPRASLTATVTSTPTGTLIPSQTSTPPGPPTLTPARPLPQAGRYDLNQWTAEDADHVIRLLNDYPNMLPESAQGKDLQAYYTAFRFASLAQKEGLLRFPDSDFASAWDWGLAFNLARTGDAAAGDHYRQLLLQALNRGETDLSNLYIWFKQQEPRLQLYLTQLEAPGGYIGSYLVEIGGRGSAFIWLLQADQGFRAYTLTSRFDFVQSTQASWMIADLDDNPGNGEEITIYFSTPDDQTTLDPPSIYNLSQIPPRPLAFIPEREIFNVGMKFDNYWAIQPGSSGGMDLTFRSTVFPACAVTIERRYHWEDPNFVLVDSHFEVEDTPLTLAYCDVVSKHAAHTWGPEAAIQIMQPLLDDWPPAKTVEGLAYPAEARDEWLYRLGILYALSGQKDQARQSLNTIIKTPSVPRSNWIQPAQDFLKNYQEGQSLYKACTLTTFCEPALALAALIETAPTDQDMLSYLRQAGVGISASGYFDFEDDGESERWFNVKHRPREKPEFWILAAYAGTVKGVRVAQIESNPPDFKILEPAFIAEEAFHLQPAVFLDGKMAFHLSRMPGSDFPFLELVSLRHEYPNRFLTALDPIETALFRGDPPKQVQKDLRLLASNPGLLCAPTWSCDAYYYLLGLASELAGDTRSAVEAYHRLWSDYSKSPFTIIARLKLLGSPLLTSTPTPTPTATTTLTPTPTLSPTPTVTGTPPTATPTGTHTYTPDPNATATPTPTASATLAPTNTATLTASPTNSDYPPP
jgi:hypothetical protein